MEICTGRMERIHPCVNFSNIKIEELWRGELDNVLKQNFDEKQEVGYILQLLRRILQRVALFLAGITRAKYQNWKNRTLLPQQRITVPASSAAKFTGLRGGHGKFIILLKTWRRKRSWSLSWAFFPANPLSKPFLTAHYRSANRGWQMFYLWQSSNACSNCKRAVPSQFERSPDATQKARVAPHWSSRTSVQHHSSYSLISPFI